MSDLSLPAGAFDDFQSATREVLAFLQEKTNFGLWMMTRTEGKNWIVLQTKDSKYGVNPGAVFNWDDSYCSEMVQGNGPQIAPRSEDVSAYLNAAIGKQVDIGAYIGVPITKKDGTLFGTMCAIDPDPKDDELFELLPLINLLGNLLGTVLIYEMDALTQLRTVEHKNNEAFKDEVTGLFNRKGWNVIVETEDMRARRYGSPVCCYIIKLRNFEQISYAEGKENANCLIRQAVDIIKQEVQDYDTVARLGDEELGILAVECDFETSETLCEKLLQAFEQAEISVTVGKSMRDPRLSIFDAMAEADREINCKS